MNVDLTAREPFEYNHANLQAGQDFKATDLHARILVNAGRAAYKTRDTKAEVPASNQDNGNSDADGSESARSSDESKPQDEPRQGSRRYRRRDMKADES